MFDLARSVLTFIELLSKFRNNIVLIIRYLFLDTIRKKEEN